MWAGAAIATAACSAVSTHPIPTPARTNARSIAALFGLTNGLISQQQYSELVTVVILSAFVPTLVAQQLFQPRVVDMEEEEALGAEDAATIGRR
jgi:hypothetical protein